MQDRTRRNLEAALAPRSGPVDLRSGSLLSEQVTAPHMRTPARQKIWEIQGGLQCSIVGTCLSHEDLTAVCRKSGVRPREEARPYEVHSYFVQQVGKDCKIARTAQKLLDQRHAGILRRVAAARTEVELTALWQSEFDAGRVPGAYWAFMTSTHVPG